MGIKNFINKQIDKRVINMFAPFLNSSRAVSGKGSYQYTPEYLLGLDAQALKTKALQIWWKSVHARGAIRQLNVLSINDGARLQSQPSGKILNLTSEQTSEISDTLESFFSLWRLQKGCSHDYQKNFNELESLAKYSWDIFGEYFALIRYNSNNRINPVNIQIINPMCVKDPVNIGNKNIIDGIEYENDIPVAIYIETIKDQTVSYERVEFVGKKSGKKFVLHGFDSEIAGAKRGTSKLAPVFHELERIQEALRLEIETIGTNAMLAGVIERSQPVVNNEKIKAMLSSTTGVPTVDQLNKKTVNNNNGGVILQNMEAGEVYRPVDTTRPNVNIPEFINKDLQWIGPAIGLSSELWLMLFGKSYTASKGSIDLTFKNMNSDLFKFTSGFNQPIYEAVIDSEIASGNIILTGWSVPRYRAGYMVSKWFGPPTPSLNPLQEAKAATERIHNLTSNGETEAQKTSGVSFNYNAERRMKETEKIIAIDQLYKNAGIDPTADEL